MRRFGCLSSKWMRRGPLLAGMLLWVAMSGGCGQTHTSRELDYPIGSKSRAAQGRAVEGGLYHVECFCEGDPAGKPVAGTERLVERGGALGFESNGQGVILATAGPEKFALPPVPTDARQYAWAISTYQPGPAEQVAAALIEHHERKRQILAGVLPAMGSVLAVAAITPPVAEVILQKIACATASNPPHCH